MKNFCELLREHAKNIIYFEKKKVLPLTKEKLKSHQDAKLCYTFGKRILKKLLRILKKYKLSENYRIDAQYTVCVI